MFVSFSKKVSLLYVIFFAVICSVTTFLITSRVMSKSQEAKETVANSFQDNCSFHIKRLNGYDLIKPILFVENDCESERLQNLKSELSNIIANYTMGGNVSSTSLYLRSFLSSEWISINGSETYSPGSMLKVPILIAYLKMNEKAPGSLNKKYTCDKAYDGNRKAAFVSKSIEVGHAYTVKELLEYMIKYSDNTATMLLMKNLDISIFRQVFDDFGLSAPDRNARSFPINAADFSRFMRALFNGSYLSMTDSEFAVDLLTKSEFKDGILKGIPSTVKVAHKFGEEGNAAALELHESAIVFLENSPYILTVMTKGKDFDEQSKLIGELSAKIYKTVAPK